MGEAEIVGRFGKAICIGEVVAVLEQFLVDLKGRHVGFLAIKGKWTVSYRDKSSHSHLKPAGMTVEFSWFILSKL